MICPMCGEGEEHQSNVEGVPKSKCAGCGSIYYNKEL